MAHKRIIKQAKRKIKKRVIKEVKGRAREGLTSSVRQAVGADSSSGTQKPIEVKLPYGIKMSTLPRQPARKHPSYTQLAAQRKGEANQRRIADNKRRRKLAPRRTRR